MTEQKFGVKQTQSEKDPKEVPERIKKLLRDERLSLLMSTGNIEHAKAMEADGYLPAEITQALSLYQEMKIKFGKIQQEIS